MSDPLTRSMPFSHDAERAVLSAFLHNPADLLPDARNTIPQEAFYHPATRLMYEVLCELADDERPIEYITLAQYLTDTSRIDKVGGQGELVELLNFILTPAHYGQYKNIVLQKHRQRQILKACQESIDDVYENPEQGAELLERVCDRFYGMSKQSDSKGQKTFQQILHTYADVWENRLSGKIETGIPTRWHSFNATFGGLTPRMWLVTAYPSEGKSSLLQNLIEDTVATGKHALLFSFEMDDVEVTDRLVTADTRLNSQRIFFPQNGVNRDETRKITASIGKMAKWGLHLRTDSSWTFEQIMAEARAVCLKHPVGMIGFDYLQLMSSSKKYGSRAEEVAYMSRSIKRLSKAVGLPCVVLSQLNDDGKTLESRAPGQDASNAVYIQTEASVKNKRGQEERVAGGLMVTKNRNGKRGHRLPITLNGATFTFEEASREGGPDLPLTGERKDWD